MDTQDTTSSKETVSKETTPEEAKSIETAAKDASAVDASAEDSISLKDVATQSRVDPLTLVDDSYWPARALRALRESRFSEAITLCDAGLHDDNPAPISGFLIKAQALASLGRLKDSLSTLTEALSADPENQMAFKLLGDIHFAVGEEEAAMSYYRRIHSQRSPEDTTGIALEIGAPLSAALKKVFMSRITSNAIDDTSERASQKKAPPKESSQTGESKIAPRPTTVERRPYRVEEQETPDNVVESVIEKTEKPTPEAPESESPTQVTSQETKIETPTEKPTLLDESPLKHETQPSQSKMSPAEPAEEPPMQSESPPMQSAEKPTQSAETRIQSVTLKRGAETESATTSKTSSKPTKGSAKAPTKTIGQTVSRITLPESFQTETMADIFMRQGLHFEAAEILRKLHTRNPSDSLKAKLEEAESGRAGK